MNITFDTRAFNKALESSRKAVLDGAVRGMHDATNDLLRESTNLAPLDKGMLRLSGGKSVEVTDDTVVGEVYFNATERDANGNLVNYALITHELGESFKDPTTPGTQPKYLERPAKENAERHQQMIVDEIRKEMA